MPHNQRSLSVTNAYRRRIALIATRLERQARHYFPNIETLDSSTWAQRMAPIAAQAQLEGIRVASGYLSAFYRSETGKGITPPAIPRDTVGRSRDGRPLEEALGSPLIGVKAALADGKPPLEAIRYGLNRGLRIVAFEAVQTPREELLKAVDDDPRFDGWQRAVSGTCAACEALSGDGGPRFEVHYGCECQPQPRVAGVKDRFPIPTGLSLFMSKTKAEQDAAVGIDAAEKIRNGEADLKDFIGHSPMETMPDFITQKPLDAVT